MDRVSEGNSVFAKFWYQHRDDYFYITRIPGNKENISASCIGGRNLIVNKFISNENKYAAGKVIEYFLSKETQIKFAQKYGKISAMEDVYYDDYLCEKINCELFRNLEFISRSTIALVDDYAEYSLKYRNILMEFLYGNSTTKEALRQIDYISTVFTIEYNSVLGIILIAFNVILMTIICISYILILRNRYCFNENIFNKKSWFLLLFGLCLNISSSFLSLGRITEFKCNSKFIFLLLGYSSYLYPILISEFSYFPKKNKYSNFIKNNSVLCYTFLYSIDFMFVLLIINFIPYSITNIIIENGMNFNTCKINNIHYIYLSFLIIFKVFLIILIALLSFLEWNVNLIYKDVKVNTYIIYLNILCLILVIIVKIVNFKNIYLNILLSIWLINIFSLTNYILVFFTRYLKDCNKNKNDRTLKNIRSEISKDSKNITNSEFSKTSKMNSSKRKPHSGTKDEDTSNTESIKVSNIFESEFF